jgi:hypothetical protein
LGLTNWFAKFIPNYANIVEPLYQLRKKNVEYLWLNNMKRLKW